MQADLRSWLGLATGAGVALIAIAVGNIGHLVYLMDVHPGVASWVQAVGSIAAIVVSVVAALWLQDRQRKLDRFASGIDALRTSRIVAASCIGVIKSMDTRSRSQTWGELHATQNLAVLDAEIEALKAIDATRLPDERSRVAIAQIRGTCVAARGLLAAMAPLLKGHPPPPKDTFGPLADGAMASGLELEASLRELLKARR